MSRRSSLSEALRGPRASLVAAALAASGCAAAPPPALPAASELEQAPRRPDGVAIDLEGAVPPARDRAATGESVVALRAPLGVDRALATVKAFFQAVVREDGDALGAQLTRDAVALSPAMAAAGRSPAASAAWDQRFRRLDYTAAAGEALYREPDVEVLREGEEGPPEARGGIEAGHLGPSDIVVRVPLPAARGAQERLFGEAIVMWLRREGESYKIYRMVEDFQLP